MYDATTRTPVALAALLALVAAGACAPLDEPPAPGASAPAADELARRGAGVTLSSADYADLGSALAAARSGDTIVVAPGTYREDLVVRKNVTITGASDDAADVVLYGSIDVGSERDVTVANLTLDGSFTRGAPGFRADGFASFTLSNVHIRGFLEGGIEVEQTEPSTTGRIDRVFVERSDIGLLVGSAPNLEVTNSVFVSNGRGGVVTRTNREAVGIDVRVTNSLFWANGFSASAAAVSVEDRSLLLRNSIVTGNHTGLSCASRCPNDHNIIWGNVTDYAVQARVGAGNLRVDPGLVDLAEGDFTLRLGSVAVDAGNAAGAPDHDFFGASRPAGEGVDIGPHERAPEGTGEGAVVRISEVMANPLDESVGEYVELYNSGSTPVDVGGWVIDDGDSTDVLFGYIGGPTIIPAGGFAVIVDPDYRTGAPAYPIADAAVLLMPVSSSTIGSGLSTNDRVLLWAQGRVVDTYVHPFDPGNGVSVERVEVDEGDSAGNWIASPCGASAGAPNCAWSPEDAAPSSGDVRITEVMANPLDEARGEYIELHNAGAEPVDLAGWSIDDGDSSDALAGWASGSTVLDPGAFAVVLDPDYDGGYTIAGDALWLTVASSATLGNGLSTDDPVTLRDAGGANADSFSHPFDPGNGVSVERSDPLGGDTAGNWVASTCAGGGSPGIATCEAAEPPPTAATVAITEVMANALDEDTGEFIELFNYGSEPVDLAGFLVSDGDASEALQAYRAGATTRLLPGAYALVLDSEYAEEYDVPAGVLRLRTPDSSIGSGLATTDPITLRAPGGALVSSWSTPFNPGNGVSAERVSLAEGDVADNWVASPCGASPGRANCAAAGEPPADATLAAAGVVISEVMANPLDEGTGEFVELFNAGASAVDLDGWLIADASGSDTIGAWESGGTALAPGAFAVVVDQDYADDYDLGGALLLVVDDGALGNGLSTSDTLTLSSPDGAVVSRYSHPQNPGNGWSVERVAAVLPDAPDTWVRSGCPELSSPGRPNCASPSAPGASPGGYGEPCPWGGADCASGLCVRDVVAGVALCSTSCTTSCAEGSACLALQSGGASACWPSGGAVDPPGESAARLLITEVVVTPGAAEMVEIHNPGDEAVSLENVWLADYPDYHGVTTGSLPPGRTDFRAHFPAGATLAAGAYATISLESAGHFVSEYGFYPDYDTWPSDANAPALVGELGSNAGLSNSAEMLVLFWWDGSSALVTDLDYLVWGSDADEGMDKSEVSVGGERYGSEVSTGTQRAAPAPDRNGTSLEHCDRDESGQSSGANGVGGTDQTTEPLDETWVVSDNPTPGAAPAACEVGCVPVCTGACGSDGCEGSCGTCSDDYVCDDGACIPRATPTGITVLSGVELPEPFGRARDLRLFTTAAQYRAYFGVEPPAGVSFATQDVLFFAAGERPFPGYVAQVLEVVDNTSELFVFTQLQVPGEDCNVLGLPLPVWTMVAIDEPASGATVLTEIYGEDEVACADVGAPIGWECSHAEPCAPGAVCAGLTRWRSPTGNCNPEWMWNTFAGAAPRAIPDGGAVVSPVVVSGLASVEVDVIIYVDLVHPDPSQLTITLRNPPSYYDGLPTQEDVVWDRESGGSSHLVLHRILRGFSGDEVVNGEWSLEIVDHETGSSGTLQAWSLELTSRWD